MMSLQDGYVVYSKDFRLTRKRAIGYDANIVGMVYVYISVHGW